MQETIAPEKWAAPVSTVDQPQREQDVVLATPATLEKRVDLLEFCLSTAKLGLLVLIIKLYRIEARPFRVVFAITCCGFLVSDAFLRVLQGPTGRELLRSRGDAQTRPKE